jgi:hypothetical protein
MLYFLQIPYVNGRRAHDNGNIVFERGLQAPVSLNELPPVHTLHIHVKNNKGRQRSGGIIGKLFQRFFRTEKRGNYEAVALLAQHLFDNEMENFIIIYDVHYFILVFHASILIGLLS